METYIKSKNTVFNCEKCSEISNELIAYQLVNGNFMDASTLAALLPLKNTKENRNELEIRQFLLNLISPTITRKDLYSWMIYGNAKGKQNKTKSKDYNDYNHIGWLSNFAEAPPIVRKAAYQYFDKMKYPEFARYMKENHRYLGTQIQFPLAKGLGADYQNIVKRYETLIKTTKSSLGERRNHKQQRPKTINHSLSLLKKIYPKISKAKPFEPNMNFFQAPYRRLKIVLFAQKNLTMSGM